MPVDLKSFHRNATSGCTYKEFAICYAIVSNLYYYYEILYIEIIYKV